MRTLAGLQARHTGGEGPDEVGPPAGVPVPDGEPQFPPPVSVTEGGQAQLKLGPGRIKRVLDHLGVAGYSKFELTNVCSIVPKKMSAFFTCLVLKYW